MKFNKKELTLLLKINNMEKNQILHRVSGEGASYWGPGDIYTFLITGAESGGQFFSMLAAVPPGGGPPPHIHYNETETFYVLEGEFTFTLVDKKVTAKAGDFLSVPPNTVHCFKNESDVFSRMILTFTPSGVEKFFEETLERAYDITGVQPDNIDEVVAKYLEAAPRYGLEFI